MPPRGGRFRDRFWGAKAAWLVGILGVMLLARLALPYMALRFVNRQINAFPGYRGQVEKVGLSLWRGAYYVKRAALFKASGELYIPFFAVERADLQLDWEALRHGRLAGEIVADRPVLNFVQGPTPETTQMAVDESWQDRVQKLLPVKINRLEIKDGVVNFRRIEGNPPVDLRMTALNATATNLSNVRDIGGGELPARVEASGRPLERGWFLLDIDLDPLAPTPTFDMRASLRGISVPDLNAFLTAFGGFNAEAGRFDLFMEAEAGEGRIKGTSKPMFRDLKIVGDDDKKKGLLRRFWEAVAGTAVKTVENKPTDRVAARIPFEGSLEDPKAGLWPAIWSVLRSGFIKALIPGFEGQAEGKKEDQEAGKKERKM